MKANQEKEIASPRGETSDPTNEATMGEPVEATQTNGSSDTIIPEMQSSQDG